MWSFIITSVNIYNTSTGFNMEIFGNSARTRIAEYEQSVMLHNNNKWEGKQNSYTHIIPLNLTDPRTETQHVEKNSMFTTERDKSQRQESFLRIMAAKAFFFGLKKKQILTPALLHNDRAKTEKNACLSFLFTTSGEQQTECGCTFWQVSTKVSITFKQHADSCQNLKCVLIFLFFFNWQCELFGLNAPV